MEVVKPHLREITEDTIIIGHSIGAAFALAVLEQLTVQIQKTILISGFVGPLGIELDEINRTIAERDFAWDATHSHSQEFALLHGTNDPYVPESKATELGKLLETPPIIIPNGGHLNEAAGFVEFPLLLEQILKQT